MEADNEKLIYVCKAGNKLIFSPVKGEEYNNVYPDLIVYHPEYCPLGLFPGCKNCEYGNTGLSFGLSEEGEIEEPKANLVIYCKIWQPKKPKIKNSAGSPDN